MAEFIGKEPCPKCGSKDNLARYGDGSGHCWSDGCGYHEYSFVNDNERPVATNKLIHTIDYRELHKRNITVDTCHKFHYGLAIYKGTYWQVASYRDDSNTVVAQHLRSADKQFKWLKKDSTVDISKLQLWGQHLFKNDGEYRKRIIITEGEVDCLSISEAFYNKYAVVSIPSGTSSAVKALKHNYEFINGYDEKIFAFDNDEAGMKCTHNCLVVFPDAKVCSYPADCKDPNDVLIKHGKACLQKIIYESSKLKPKGVLDGQAMMERINNYIEGRLNPDSEHAMVSYSTQYPKLDLLMGGGFRKKEMITFTAGTGNGKTTLAKEIMYHLMMKHNLKVGLICLEEGGDKTSLDMLSLYCNKRLHLSEEYEIRDLIESGTMAKGKEELFNKEKLFTYDDWGSIDGEELLSKMKYFIKGLDCDFLLLDHISIAISGLDINDERKAIDFLSTELRKLVEETGIGLIVVSHLRKGNNNPHEEGGRVYINDLRGSHGLAQLSDFVVALEGNPQDKEISNYRLVRILKNRYTGDVGVSGVLHYDKTTGRLSETNIIISDVKELKENNNESKAL